MAHHVVGSGVPHWAQKREPGRTFLPQSGQRTGSGSGLAGSGVCTEVPQCLQNRAPGRTASPQEGHTSGSCFSGRDVEGRGVRLVLGGDAGGAAASASEAVAEAGGAGTSGVSGSVRVGMRSSAVRSCRARCSASAPASWGRAWEAVIRRRVSSRSAACRSKVSKRSLTVGITQECAVSCRGRAD